MKWDRQNSQEQLHQQITQESIFHEELVTSSQSTCVSTQVQIEKDAPHMKAQSQTI